MKETLYNILYNGLKIHTNLSADECTEVLQDLSERFYSGNSIDPTLIKLEEVYG